MGREVVHDDPDLFGFGEMDVAELAHALGEVGGGTSLGDLDLAPGAIDVEEDEEIDGAVALVLEVEAL